MKIASVLSWTAFLPLYIICNLAMSTWLYPVLVNGWLWILNGNFFKSILGGFIFVCMGAVYLFITSIIVFVTPRNLAGKSIIVVCAFIYHLLIINFAVTEGSSALIFICVIAGIASVFLSWYIPAIARDN